MYTQTVRKIGNSEGIIIPKAFLETLGLSPGKEVGLEVVGGQLILKPIQARYNLEDLVAQMSDENEHPETSSGRLVGEEVIEYEENVCEEKKQNVSKK